jgi:hypothetical protein
MRGCVWLWCVLCVSPVWGQGGRLEGVVVPDVVSPPATLEGILVSVQPGPRSLEVGVEGAFLFEGLAPGQYQVQAFGEGIASDGVAVDLGEEGASGVEVVVRAAWSLEGSVVEASGGLPLEGARVRLVEAGFEVESDVEGRWGFGALAPGAYTAQISKEGFVGVERVVLVDGPGARLEVALRAVEPGWSLSVTVQNHQGAPLEGAAVVVFGGAALSLDPVLTDADGWAMIPALPSGTYAVEASREGFLSGRAEEVALRGDRALTLMLAPADFTPRAPVGDGCAAAPGRSPWSGLVILMLFAYGAIRGSIRAGAEGRGTGRRGRRW